MSLFNYTRQRYYVLQNASATNNYGIPELASDFKTQIVEIEQTGLNGELAIFVSDQYYAPDVSSTEGPNNDYHEVAYTDESGIGYTPANRYNPATSTPGGDRRFNVEITGARWIIACVLNVSAGTVDTLIVDIYDNQ